MPGLASCTSSASKVPERVRKRGHIPHDDIPCGQNASSRTSSPAGSCTQFRNMTLATTPHGCPERERAAFRAASHTLPALKTTGPYARGKMQEQLVLHYGPAPDKPLLFQITRNQERVWEDRKTPHKWLESTEARGTENETVNWATGSLRLQNLNEKTQKTIICTSNQSARTESMSHLYGWVMERKSTLVRLEWDKKERRRSFPRPCEAYQASHRRRRTCT